MHVNTKLRVLEVQIQTGSNMALYRSSLKGKCVQGPLVTSFYYVTVECFKKAVSRLHGKEASTGKPRIAG